MAETIDVGPVWCPTCKREYGDIDHAREREALRRISEEFISLSEAVAIARDALAAPAPAEPREGEEAAALTTTFHERTARRHDNGEHKGESPVLGCAYCEMEHPKGRFRTLMAEREGEVLLDRERIPEGWRVEWSLPDDSDEEAWPFLVPTDAPEEE